MGIIKIENLSKIYGRKKALDSISLNINKGDIFGVLGPNGAGKTTLISIVTTLIYPTSGKVVVGGYDISKDGKDVRKMIGVVFQDFLLDEDLTAFDNLDIHARLYKINNEERIQTIDKFLKVVDLYEERNNKVSTFSGGMKRRLEIARGLMNHTSILFLDEPTLGLDPIAKRNVWKYIKDIHKKNKITIILATNNMYEAEELCNKIAIINKGKIMKVDTLGNLKKRFKKGATLEEVFINLTKEK